MSKQINLTLKVWRQNRGQNGQFKTYEATNIDTDASFLEMLDVVNDELTLKGVEPIAFEHDCREGHLRMLRIYREWQDPRVARAYDAVSAAHAPF